MHIHLRHPSPRHFSDFDAYEAAYVAFKVSRLPVETPFDSYDDARAKRLARAAAQEAASVRAFEVWGAWVECCEDRFERGIGAGWE